MAGNYTTTDTTLGTIDLDAKFITDAWLVDQFVGGQLWTWGNNQFGNLGNGTTSYYSSPIQVGSLTNWRQVTAGKAGFVVGLKNNGTMWVWGYGADGEMANSITNSQSSPIQVGDLTTWNKVGCTNWTAAAIKTDGTLWGWGLNNYGMIGNNTNANYSSPIQVGALNNWKDISNNGAAHFLALKTDGTLWTWGYNTFGNIGNGTTIDYSSPVQVGSLNNWSKVAAGSFASASIKTDGTLWTWGDNSHGQLGLENNGAAARFNTTTQTTLKLAAGGTQWSTTDANTTILTHMNHMYGNTSGFISSTGQLWTVGYNNPYGNMGNGTTINYSSPVQVGALSNWKQVSLGSNYTMAVKTDGTLWGCGYEQTAGVLGRNTISNILSTPVQIGTQTNWKQVVCGSTHTLAVKTDGTLWSWGRNTNYVLGRGLGSEAVSYSSPCQIGALTTWSNIATGTDSCAAIKTDGTLWTWGYNNCGQLGLGNRTLTGDPTQVGALTNWKQVAIGDTMMVAVKTDGTLWAWGNDSNGYLGNGVSSGYVYYSSPIQIGALTNWKQVACGGNWQFTPFTVAVKTDGTLWGFGSNASPINFSSSPTQIGTSTNWTQVACGYSHFIAYNSLGQVYSKGSNASGQLGAIADYLKHLSSPVQVGSLTNWKQIALGEGHSFAIKTDGTLWAWGQNNYGSLGIGNTIKYSSPVQVGSLTNWKKVVYGTTYVMTAIKTDGTLWTCGYNTSGQLGNGNTINYSSPIQVGSLTNWKDVNACGYGIHAITYKDLG